VTAAIQKGIAAPAHRGPGPTDDDGQTRGRLRRSIACSLSTATCSTAAEGSGGGAAAAAIRAAVREANGPIDRGAVGARVPDELSDDLAIAGTPSAVLDRRSRPQASLGARGIRELARQPDAPGDDRRAVRASYCAVIEAVARRSHGAGTSLHSAG